MIYAILIFIVVGVLDWCIKELPMYPGKRPDSFFWKTIWGGVCWGAAALAVLLICGWSGYIYLPLIFIEDLTYFLLRALVYKEAYSKTYYLPLTVFGYNSFPLIYAELWVVIYLLFLSVV